MSAMYLSIATDLAQRIINGEFAVGSRLSGRTLLASHYNVSSETIRKAVGLLKDAGVVQVSQGKEISVISSEQAYYFIEQHKSMQSVYSLRQELELLLQQKLEIDRRFEGILTDIIGYSDRLRNLTPYNPVEVTVPPSSHLVGKTVADIRLWQHTGATIVAIRRNKEVMISPGPLAVFAPHDRLVVVGKQEVWQAVTAFVDKAAEGMGETLQPTNQ